MKFADHICIQRFIYVADFNLVSKPDGIVYQEFPQIKSSQYLRLHFCYFCGPSFRIEKLSNILSGVRQNIEGQKRETTINR